MQERGEKRTYAQVVAGPFSAQEEDQAAGGQALDAMASIITALGCTGDHVQAAAVEALQKVIDNQKPAEPPTLIQAQQVVEQKRAAANEHRNYITKALQSVNRHVEAIKHGRERILCAEEALAQAENNSKQQNKVAREATERQRRMAQEASQQLCEMGNKLTGKIHDSNDENGLLGQMHASR
jgi:DNA anti-recombination protein RmuC